MEEDDVFCTRCGKSVDEDPRKAQSPPKMVSPGNERYGMEPSLDAEDETDRRNSRYIMIAAAASTPQTIAGMAFLSGSPISAATSAPVQAPVPGSGMATSRKSPI